MSVDNSVGEVVQRYVVEFLQTFREGDLVDDGQEHEPYYVEVAKEMVCGPATMLSF